MKKRKKNKFKHIKIHIIVVAQKFYSAEHRTRIDTITSTSVTAVHKKNNNL